MKLYMIAADSPEETAYMSTVSPDKFVTLIDVCCGQFIEEYFNSSDCSNFRYEYIPRHKRRRDDPRLIDVKENLPKLPEMESV